VTFGFYLVFLGTAFRLTALKENPGFGTFLSLVTAGTAYWILLPGCRIAAILTILVAVIVSFVAFNYGETASADDRRDNPWKWAILPKHIALSILFAPFLLLARAVSRAKSSKFSAFAFVAIPAVVFIALAYPRIAAIFNVPTLLVFEAALWLLVLTEIQAWSKRLELPIVTLLVLWGVFLSAAGWNYSHQVRQLPEMPNGDAQDAKAIFSAWLNSRKDADEYKNGPYPVVLVSAEGGGIRAAYITAKLLTELQQADPSFKEHLFAISGVSGGAVGATVFAGECKVFSERQKLNNIPELVLTKKNTFLAGPLAALLGPEIFQRILPTRMPVIINSKWSIGAIDRATSLERAFEDAFRTATGSSAMETDFCTNYASSADVPLLLLNATDAVTGKRVVLTPAHIDNDADAIYPIQLDKELHIAASTAAFLSARFPLVSPAGELAILDRKLLLVDGGYFDNTGTETLAALLRELSTTPSAKKCAFIILVPKFAETNLKEAIGLHGNFESVPIIEALLKARDRLSASSRTLKTLIESMNMQQIPCDLLEIKLNLDIYTVPLGWCLTAQDSEKLNFMLSGKLPRREPPDPFPPQRIALRAAYLKSLDMRQQVFEGKISEDKEDLGPIYGEDPPWVPEIESLPMTDFPPFLRSWCGVASADGQSTIPLQEALKVVHLLRLTRNHVFEPKIDLKELLAEYGSIWSNEHGLAFAKTLGWFAENDGRVIFPHGDAVPKIDWLERHAADNEPHMRGIKYLVYLDNESGASAWQADYDAYGQYERSVMNGFPHMEVPQSTFALLAEKVMRARWDFARQSYRNVLDELRNISSSRDTIAAIEAESQELELMYQMRWPNKAEQTWKISDPAPSTEELNDENIKLLRQVFGYR
jgi:hypothetical protein